MDLSYPEWDDVDEFGFSEKEWRKANPPINEIRAKQGLPPYIGNWPIITQRRHGKSILVEEHDGTIPTPEEGSQRLT